LQLPVQQGHKHGVRAGAAVDQRSPLVRLNILVRGLVVLGLLYLIDKLLEGVIRNIFIPPLRDGVEFEGRAGGKGVNPKPKPRKEKGT
jgi:hypothetical protein